ncbi:hypothetical protein [Erythrobacter litoralis]|uniref:hypothetical protein n=1 Tax=Erythrobacter litoralis TaxID=39960 RepID=UPI002434A84C|nr:hypothetical protein [Erythrobacter litoralis]
MARVFAMPLVLLAATLVGLVLGLTGDGLRDVAAWILVGLPLALLALFLFRTYQ